METAESGLLSALNSCRRVAGEEHRVAGQALDRCEAMLLDLLGEIAPSPRHRPRPAKSAVSEGPTGGSLEAFLQGLSGKVQAGLEATRTDLSRKAARLDQFTILLFGRTMVGKSTLREAITGGDGSTIGRGAQRTTREVREYDWHGLRVVDTPGVGAYEGEEDRQRALDVVAESDLILFLLSSDGIQQEAFQAMRRIRADHKPVVFVLNYRLDLRPAVRRRRFLADPEAILLAELAGHRARIQELAGAELRLREREVRVIAVQTHAALLATRPEHATEADQLHRASRLDVLMEEVQRQVIQHGPVLRLRTLLDGAARGCRELEGWLGAEAEGLERVGAFGEAKQTELKRHLAAWVEEARGRLNREVSLALQPIRGSVSGFVDDHLERADVRERWRAHLDAYNLGAAMERGQRSLLDGLHAVLAEAQRQTELEQEAFRGFHAEGVAPDDGWDWRRIWGWSSAGASAAATVTMALNFWNPVGWVLAGASAVAAIFSWLTGRREERLRKRRTEAADQLRRELDRCEEQCRVSQQEWLTRLEAKLAEETRRAAAQTAAILGAARAVRETARECARLVEQLDRRLLIRAGSLVGLPVAEGTIERLVRRPGQRAKFIVSADRRLPARFAAEVGRALAEVLDPVPEGDPARMVACALRPGRVNPEAVRLYPRGATVRLSPATRRSALGQNGGNLRLAGELLRREIRLEASEC